MQGTVISAEPVPATFAAFQQNIARHKRWRDDQGAAEPAVITAHECGVGDGSRTEATFTHYPSAAGTVTAAYLYIIFRVLSCHTLTREPKLEVISRQLTLNI